MKRSVTIRTICLIVAVAVLGSVAAYAAVTGSPYQTLKNSVLDALTYRNATSEAIFTLTVNGVVEEMNKQYVVAGDDGSLSKNFDENGKQTGLNYSSNGLHVYPNVITDDGVQWYYCNSYKADSDAVYVPGSSFGMFSASDRGSASMRFTELLIDALVGDLKNNVTMTSENGVRHIKGTLTEAQMPELAKAGIDMLVEQSRGGYSYSEREVSFDGKEYIFEQTRLNRGDKIITTYKQAVRAMTDEELAQMKDGTLYEKYGNEQYWGTDLIDGVYYVYVSERQFVKQVTVPATRADYADVKTVNLPMKSLVISYIHGEADVDKSGNLTNAVLTATATMTDIFGDVHELQLSADVKFSDIGTSKAECPIPGLQQLLTPEYKIAHFGSEDIGVYFTLNKDGSVNAGSMTTTYPGELFAETNVISVDMTALPVAVSVQAVAAAA